MQSQQTGEVSGMVCNRLTDFAAMVATRVVFPYQLQVLLSWPAETHSHSSTRAALGDYLLALWIIW